MIDEKGTFIAELAKLSICSVPDLENTQYLDFSSCAPHVVMIHFYTVDFTTLETT